jgi:uncharacterized protein YfaS (alpha-2-macroglobulin family)/tetratricopeptide (TPR) repeat protein
MNSRTLVVAVFSIITCSALCRHALVAQTASPPEFAQIKAQAESQYADGSFAKANELYRQAQRLDLSPSDARWVQFRLADCAWRAQASTNTHDSTVFDNSAKELEALIRAVERVEDRDIFWAEANESLGDFWWTRRDQQDWGRAWPHYSNALDYWAGSELIDPARDRYLHIVWTMADPPWTRDHQWLYYQNNIPLEILDNAAEIAVTPEDQSHAHYLIAMALRARGDWASRLRIPREFEAAITAGKSAFWYDDALFAYGEWLANQGPAVLQANGQWRATPDYIGAVAVFKRLLREFRKGETRYYDNAQSQIEQITGPRLTVGVSNIFLPESEIQFHLGWRNIHRVDLSLYRVDLTRDVTFAARERDPMNAWINRLNLDAGERLRTWEKDTEDKGDHVPGQSTERLDGPLPVGAYVIEASSQGGKTSRELILVSSAAVTLKTANQRAVAFVCDALTGSPIPAANVRMWRFVADNNGQWVIASATKATDGQGLAPFDQGDFGGGSPSHAQYLAMVSAGDQQTFAQAWSNSFEHSREPWKIYAFTDRPAYRPGDTVQWKILARTWSANGYRTPSDQSIEYEITSPRGEKITSGPITINAFGSAWGEVELSESTALGEYHIQFWKDKNHQDWIGQATLFRMEEYKLPEFKVTVSTPEENGRPKAFRLGEYVQATIQADYYFGGPVSNASAEVLIYQNPYYHWWTRPREFPWCYESPDPWRWRNYGGGQIIKRETLKTDAEGRAVLTFETPADSPQDYEYRIEARVIDASRREVVGSGTVRVTRQRYYVHPLPRHNLYQPNDKVEIDITAIDANDQPVSVEGTVNVTREQWKEVWVDPMGKEISGDALLKLQSEMSIFPPPPPTPGGAGAPGWWCKYRGYVSEDVLTTIVKLNKDGKATFSFTPSKEGFYRIAWMSKDGDSPMPITAEANVWVTTNTTTELGYRTGGVQIIIDSDTARVGQTAPVMIVTPTNDRYVLFSIEGHDLYDLQVVHITGTAKLVQVPIEAKYVPNVYLSSLLAHAAQMHMDTKEVVIPPVEQYLNVTVTADREQYLPGEDGSFTVNVKDADGKPVQAEVALSVFDEAVTYIQQDMAGDPRQFFFDQRQWNVVQTGSTFNQRAFVKLIKGENDQLIDARIAGQHLHDDEGDHAHDEDIGGGGGGFGGGGKRLGFPFQSGQTGGMNGLADAMESVAAPMAQTEGAVAGRELMGLRKESSKALGQPADLPGEAGAQPAVQVRTDFRATLFWQPDLITDEDGTAHVKLKYGDSLTTWLAKARVASKGYQFGIAETTTRTQMPLIARLQAPRFFLVGDVVTISGVINNNTDEKLSVTPELKAEGLILNGIMKDGVPSASPASPIEVAANSEARVDWQVSVESSGNGEAKLILTARGGKYADAMEKTYAIYEHGIEKFIAKSGKVRGPGNEVTIKLDIPRERKPASTVLAVQISPSMAVTMLDSLPYLVEYPYGCTEQTMSRFLPAAITAKTFKDLGVNPDTVMNKVFGGIEQEFVDKTHPKGKRELTKLQEITNASLDRLYDFQHNDGGWGWWKDGDSDRFMTAYVLWGLCLAHEAELDVKLDVIDRAAAWLDSQIVEEEFSPDRQAWMLHALATHHDVLKQGQIGEFETTALTNLWTRREQLNAYTRALLALGAHYYGDEAKARTLVANLENGVKRDDRPDTSVIIGAAGANPNDAVMATAHWGEDGFWWRWSDGGVEATAFALKAVLAIDPKNALIEPVTNWLIKNRRGAQWSNTRDTAITVLALNDYLRASGELSPEMEYELFVNGRSIVTKKLTAEDALSAPTRFVIDREYVNDGGNDIRIVRKSGSGPIYFSAEASFYSLEEPIPAAGNEIFGRREYYKLVPRPTLLKGYVYDRIPVTDGGSVASGERVEVVLTIEAKNNYEYLVFEDLKPAGLEAAAIQSGAPVYARQLKSGAVQRTFGDGSRAVSDVMDEQAISGDEDYTGQMAWVYQELRDRKVAMFIDHLPEGVWEIRYDLRAEVPGRFHALPVLGYAMYVPEIKCNGAEMRMTVLEGEH